jgi:hypothetical protein
MSPRKSREKLTAAKFIGFDRQVSPDDVLHLMQERDRQKLLDTRTPAQVWLGDPPPNRSALAQRKQNSPQV